MARDTSVDLREEAIAAADIESSDEDGDLDPELANPPVTRNSGEATAIGEPTITAREAPEADLTRRTKASPVPGHHGKKRRRLEATGDLPAVTPYAQTTAAGQQQPENDSVTETPKPKRRIRTEAASSKDAIAGRTRARIRREPYADATTTGSRDAPDSGEHGGRVPGNAIVVTEGGVQKEDHERKSTEPVNGSGARVDSEGNENDLRTNETAEAPKKRT